VGAVVALLVWPARAADAGAPTGRALVAILPAQAGAPALTALAARPDLSLGLASTSLGAAPVEQVLLDLGQGTRVSGRLYPSGLPPLELAPGGRISGWAAARERARGAPAAVVPGLLGKASGEVAYVGVEGGPGLPALAAADREGRIDSVSLGPARDVARRAVRAWERAPLVVAELPRGAAGPRALDAALAARAEGDVVIVLTLGGGGPALAPMGVAGVGEPGGALTSSSTRRRGLVVVTDVAPTVLRALGRPVPGAMEGRALEVLPRRDPAALAALGTRLEELGPRRYAVLPWALGGALALVAALGGLRGRAGARRGARIVALGACWAPGLCLLTAALRPSLPVEVAVLVLGSLGLGVLGDRLVPWPRGPALPAAVVLVAHAVDLARGSPLVAESLLGVNPLYGARFYGVGNQLEATFAVLLLVGVGAALGRAGAARARAAFALATTLGAVVVGWGRLGADVGGVITLAAGGTAAIGALLTGRARPVAAAGVVLAPLVAVGALALLDSVTGGDAHLVRSVLRAEGPGALWDVALRRVGGSLGGLASPATALATALALGALVTAALRREALARPLRGLLGLRAGFVGAWVATLAGALANDSGPTMLVIGTAALALLALYAHAGLARAPGRGPLP
jgi:hypothetical protein